jgi:RHS repeat-associated protein
MQRICLVSIAVVSLAFAVIPCFGQVAVGGPVKPVGPARGKMGPVSAGSSNSKSNSGSGNSNLFSYAGGPDEINLGNLNIHWDIPIRSKAGRGLNFDYDLTYDSSIWYPVTSGSTTTWQPATNWGWNGLSQAGQVYATYTVTTTSGTCGEYGSGTYEIWTYGAVYYHDQYARVHQFATGSSYITTNGVSGCPTPGAHPSQYVTSTDGMGMQVSFEPAEGALMLSSFLNKDGTTISPPIYINSSPSGTPSYLETDGNGNQITASNGTFTDTLGTTALNIIGSAPSSTTISYANNSGTSTYTVNYEEVNIKTNFGCSGIAEYSQSNVYLPHTIELPDGRQYTFTYEQTPGNTGYTTGRVASVQTPTGGTVKYTYTGGSNGIECTDGSTAGIERTTPDTGSSYWNYARSGVSGSLSTTTITTPPANGSQDQTVIHFLTDGAASYANFYEIERQIYSGSSTLLETVLTCYEPASNSSACSQTAGDTGTSVVEPITRVQKTFQWPGSTTLSSGYLDTYDTLTNPLTHAVYDYASGVSYGSLLQTTTTTYTYVNTGDTVEAPQEAKVTDGSGTEIADTKYTYTSTVTTTSGTPSQQSGGPFVENLASVAQWVSGSTYLTSSYTYYDTGNVNQATDVNGNTTTYTYGGCSNSFPTQVSTPTGGSTVTSLATQATWNCNGGVQLTSVDVNGNTTTYAYGSDPYWRPTSVTNNATGAVTSYAYPNSSSSSSSSTMNFNGNSSTNTSVVTYDGLGRAVLQQTQQAPGSSTYDSVSAAYDSRGRSSYQSVPYAGTEGETVTTGPGVTTTYDALNRRITVTDGGGGTKQYTYVQNDVLITAGPAPSGENPKKRNLQYNGAGWLTSVCEVTSLSGSGSCGQTNAQTGYWTKYTYDGGGRLTQVQQNAQSSSVQTRQIAYDGLSRKTSESIPEWSAGTGSPGSATYNYDSATSACTSGSTGDLVQSIDHIGNTTCYTYDKLHRPLSTFVASGSYASVTPAAYYVYDAATYSGAAMQNAKGVLAEAYTCATSACSSKLTDIYTSTSPVTSGAMSGGVQSQMWESTPHSGGYFFTQDTYYPNGVVGAVSASLVGASTGSTTNLITDSEQVGGSGWALYCAGNSDGVVIDTTAVPAPDGTYTATQFTMPSSYTCGSSNPYGALTNAQGGLTAGDTYTVSAWLKGAAGGESVSIGLNDCATTGVTLTTSWQRYEVTYSSISSTVANCADGSRGFEVIGWTANSTYYIWGPQTVQAASEEPYVATTDGAATYIGIPNLTYGVDGEGRPSTASDGTNNLVTATAYNSASGATSVTYGNASTGSANDIDSFSYDSNTYRPTGMTFSIKPTSNAYQVTTALTWNQNGSLQQMAYTDGNDSTKNQTCSYSADDLSRVASVNCGSSGWGQSFSYDPFGNINKTVTGAAGTAYSVAYNAATNQVSGSGVSYDANGNQTASTPAATIAWNAWNVPTTVSGISITYDALGRQVEKGSGSAYSQFVYHPSGARLAVYSGGLVKGVVALPGGGTAIYNSSGLAYIRHTDWLGSSRLATTWAHAVYSKEAYAPFGETYNEAGTADRSFTGDDQDVVTGSGGTGLYDFLYRKHDPSAGRWVSPDPLGWGAVDVTNPQSLNRYAYVLNDPLRSYDSSGLECVWDDGSFDAADDPDTGSEDGCQSAGGTYIPPDLFETAYLINGQLTNIQYGDSSSAANPDIVANWLSGGVETDGFDSVIQSYLTEIDQSGIYLYPRTFTVTEVWQWATTGTHTPVGCANGVSGCLYHHGNWCGQGGSGTPVDGQDAACMVHDFLYAKFGFEAADNYNGYNPALQEINQGLCDTAGSGAINLWFGTMIAIVSLNPEAPTCQ